MGRLMGNYDKNLSTKGRSEVTTGSQETPKERGDSRGYKTEM